MRTRIAPNGGTVYAVYGQNFKKYRRKQKQLTVICGQLISQKSSIRDVLEDSMQTSGISLFLFLDNIVNEQKQPLEVVYKIRCS